MLNLETNAVIHSRDIIWLHKLHKDWVINESTTMITSEDDVIKLPIGKQFDTSENNKVNIENTENNKIKTNEKIFCKMRKLESWFNPQAKQAIKIYKDGREISLEKVNLALLTTSSLNEPTTFDEAWNCEDEDHQKLWREAINKEIY